MGEPLDGKGLADQVRAEITEAVERLGGTGPPPGLATVLVGDDPASAVYVRNKQRACEKCGFAPVDHQLPFDATQATLLELIQRLNGDTSVHGILVQLPLPEHIDELAVLDAIDPAKDVDGLHPANVGLLAQGRPRFIPATPLGILSMLLRHGIETEGQNAVILGRSNLVGRPMAALLSRKGLGGNATTTLAHSHTQDLASLLRSAHILIAAVGRPQFVTADMIKPRAVVIDVGINRLEDGRLVGDVDYTAVVAVSSLTTPVPGGVGPMTIAMLLQNTAQAWCAQTGRIWPAPWDVAAGALAGVA